MALVLFARIGWMRWYKGPQTGDEKPVGGGKYNKDLWGTRHTTFFLSAEKCSATFNRDFSLRNSGTRILPTWHLSVFRLGSLVNRFQTC